MWLNVNCQFRICDWAVKNKQMSAKDIKSIFEIGLNNLDQSEWCGIPSEFNREGDNCLNFNLLNSKNGDYIVSITGDLRHCEETDVGTFIKMLNGCVKKFNIDRDFSSIKSFVGLIHNGYDLSRTFIMDYNDKSIKELV